MAEKEKSAPAFDLRTVLLVAVALGVALMFPKGFQSAGEATYAKSGYQTENERRGVFLSLQAGVFAVRVGKVGAIQGVLRTEGVPPSECGPWDLYEPERYD
jgi:hypothetical protein